MNEKVWKISCSWILVSSLTMTNVANATCTPTPDCASIGYTETSCEGDFVRCPFDISKLLCLPCDSKYQYDCSGANITGGVGTSCGGKYASCTCLNGGTFNNGECPPVCTVGMIYYSDKSCSEEVDATKTAIGVVVKDNTLIVALNIPDMRWASNINTDVSGITNYTSSSDAQKDYNGKANTLAILEAYSSDTTSDNAAVYCNSYSTIGTSNGEWYLPAMGELYTYVYNNYEKVKAGWDKIGTTISDTYFASSSEYDSTYFWSVNSNNGTMGCDYKNEVYGFSIACFLEI